MMKNYPQIHSRDHHMEFTGKNKVSNTTWAKLHGLIGQKQQNSFQQTHAENLFVSIRQAGKQESKRSAWSLSFSKFFILSIFLSYYFSEIYFPFCFGQMFHGLRTSIFDFYWGLALQFSCITVTLSEGSFLFAVACN